MYYGEIKKCDIANGEGVRVSLFVSGCTHHCPGCFNADTWNFKYGSEYTDQTEKEILEALSPSYINGLTLLGGEPFEPENQKTLVGLLRKVRESYPEKNIWCYTGYLYDEQLLNNSRARCEYTDEMLSMIDVLVDFICNGNSVLYFCSACRLNRHTCIRQYPSQYHRQRKDERTYPFF